MADDGFFGVIDRVLGFEGGYVNDPADPGGETNFGISKRQYPDINIRALTRREAVEIYFRDYWTPYHLAELPPAIGGKIFDLGVNMGTVTAIRLLQRAAGAGAPGSAFRVDGQIGPMTIAAVKTSPEEKLLEAIRILAMKRYETLIRQHPAFERFRRGWMRRATA